MSMWHSSTITCADGVFHLRGAHSSYLFRLTPFGHLEHIHYGAAVATADAAALAQKSVLYGSSVLYSARDERYCLDTLPLEWSGSGRGDYRVPPLELEGAAGRGIDFRYVSHTVAPGSLSPTQGLPGARGGEATLSLTLRDETLGAELTLYYTVYPEEDVIVRRSVLKNLVSTPLAVRGLMSFSLDLRESDLLMTTLEGEWIREAHQQEQAVRGTLLQASRTGFSSNRANPGFFLRQSAAGETHGRVWGFNLIYSGNHHACVSAGGRGHVRVMQGVSPERFVWTLGQGDRFETPEAVLTFSEAGVGGMSRQMHDFVRAHLVPDAWARRERPVLANSWEAYMFRFDEAKLLAMARKAKKLGAELFVLDDGWFGARDDDSAGLGDYSVNPKKLPHGLDGLSRRLGELGLGFGLWFEPEAVNENSDLFRAHPDWAVPGEGREPVYGRHELLLDLTRAEVRDYIVENVGRTLDEANVSYVKWDMNRHLAHADGAYAHRYILGLYDVLRRIFGARPEILLESCSSGGNRFDLGMLCFSPQIWASDNTDPIERLDIQKGLSCFYPPSAMGCHVSDVPHAQTLRSEPLATRFHAAAFGALGYELDLTALKSVEETEIAAQIAFYKAHRRTFQFGRFYRLETHDAQREAFACVAQDGSEALVGFFRRLAAAAPAPERLPCPPLEDAALYDVTSVPQTLRIAAFGRLISYALPVKLSAGGFLLRQADRLRGLPNGRESYTLTGAALRAGLSLAPLFTGTGYAPELRLPGDFGSDLYLISRREN